MARLTRMTTTSGRSETRTLGEDSAWLPCGSSAGSNSEAMVARSRDEQVAGRRVSIARTVSFSSAPCGGLRAAKPPQPTRQHDRGGDHAEPRRGEGRGAEERHGDGVLQRRRAGQRRHGEGHSAKRDRGRHQPARDIGPLEQAHGHRCENEQGDKETYTAIGDDGAGQDHGEDGTSRPELLGHETRDGFDRAAILHDLAEYGAEQKQREELREELRGAAHEGLGPVRKKRLAGSQSSDQSCKWRDQQHAPAAIGQEDEQSEADEDAEKSHEPRVRCDREGRRGRGWSACRGRPSAPRGTLAPSGALHCAA